MRETSVVIIDTSTFIANTKIFSSKKYGPYYTISRLLNEAEAGTAYDHKALNFVWPDTRSSQIV